MKKLLVLASLILSSQVMAGAISFECKSEKIDGVHRFSGKGVVVVDDFGNAEGLINLQTEKANEDQSIQIFEQVKVDGFLRHYEAGKITSRAFDQLFLQVDNSYLKKISIALNVEYTLLSNVISVDNFLYRSNCYTVVE